MDLRPASDPVPPLDPATVLSSIGEPVYDWDVPSDNLSWAAGAARLLRRIDPLVLASGTSYDGGIFPRSGTGRAAHILGARQVDDGMGVAYALRYALRTADGKLLWLEDTGRWFAGADGRPALAHGVVRQISAPSEHEAGRRDLDPLTDQLTLAAFIARADRLIASASAHGQSAAAGVALQDLARINREHGFETGTYIIGAIARRLAAALRRADTVARIEGGRFMALLSPCDPTALGALATRFTQAISGEPIATPAGPIAIAVQVVVLPVDASLRDGGHLVRRLDAWLDGRAPALASAASPARAASTETAPDPVSGSDEIRAEHILAALNEDRVVLVYQPIAEAAGETVVLHEGLTRIRLDNGRLLGAAAIVPAAERLGLLPQLDQRVLELGLSALRRHGTARLALNVSAPSLVDLAWLGRLEAIAARQPDIVGRLTIEITETAAIADLAAAAGAVAHLKQCGITVAIDDFGAGHTSFRILRDLSADIVKIDGAFVQNLARSPDDRFFVRTLIDLARHRDMKVVAEWVRDGETARMLRGWGADYLQGEYIGMPASVLCDGAESPRRLNSC
jgi:EAL domain-containing protein (putative c-di-GMP-specific phosphodiesterase class I)/GGDEF domain-containing protein